MKWAGVLVAFVIGILLGYYLFSRPQSTSAKIITTTDTIRIDTGSHTISVKPVPYEVKVYIHDTTLREVDSAAIVADYLSTVIYDSVIVDDSSLYLRYRETISHNRSQSIMFDYKNRRVTTVIVNKVYPTPKLRGILLGGGLSVSKRSSDISGSMGYINDKMVYTASYGFLNNNVTIHAYYTFKL